MVRAGAFQPRWHDRSGQLTGAIIIGLGHENAGVFSNDDALCDGLLVAAKTQGEGAWRMPLGEAYDKKLKSRIADVKNVSRGEIHYGGRLPSAVRQGQRTTRILISQVSHRQKRKHPMRLSVRQVGA